MNRALSSLPKGLVEIKLTCSITDINSKFLISPLIAGNNFNPKFYSYQLWSCEFFLNYSSIIYHSFAMLDNIHLLKKNPIYIYKLCLSVLFLCLKPINVKTAEPIGPNFLQDLTRFLGIARIEQICLKSQDFSKSTKNKRYKATIKLKKEGNPKTSPPRYLETQPINNCMIRITENGVATDLRKPEATSDL